MNLTALNRVCFTICILCIVFGTVLALALIWGDFDKEFLWKSELSLSVLFLAAALALSVSRTLGGKERGATSDGSADQKP
jgi:hypothetical protein